ncbi:MAG: hypothetical protein U5L45_00330 [Saprospiraceae bacterium]|nr:hypothetical protein [Saprospiraceae bacterium]
MNKIKEFISNKTGSFNYPLFIRTMRRRLYAAKNDAETLEIFEQVLAEFS